MAYAPRLILGLIFVLAQPTQAENVSTRLRAVTLNANLEQAADWPAGTTLLITHGTLSHNGSEIITTLQTLFAEYGISSLAINLGLGTDNRRGAYDCALPQRHKHGDAPAEIAAWLSWLKGRGAANIVPLGHSRGGNQTAMFVADYSDPAVSRMILVAPALQDGAKTAQSYQASHGSALAPILAQAQALVAAGKPEALLVDVGFLYCRKATVAAASFLSYYDIKPRASTAALLGRIDLPTLVFVGSEDVTVPNLAKALAPAAKADNITLQIIDGADHFFRDLYADDLVESAVEFLAPAPEQVDRSSR